MKVCKEEEIVYQTSNASLTQSDIEEKYRLRFFAQEIILRPCELISLRRKIQAVDIVNLLSHNTPDVEVIPLISCDRIFVFTIHEILELKEVLDGTFAMLELNSIVKRRLTDPIGSSLT